MELDETGEVKAYYIYGLGLIGREDAQGQYSSYHSELRGSTTLLTNEQGTVTDRYTYGLCGELEQREGTTTQPFQYNGRDGHDRPERLILHASPLLPPWFGAIPEPRPDPRGY
ncbi:hypothetical protein [Paenibacillus sp. GM2]|uniref:hypothetical protein n=1 Tax=Paenibacillus sp. GM2 TaxID=1622070 RepID=UPI000A7B1DCA|nr:hypothetical protein [Paenibacillus sp. GM2]